MLLESGERLGRYDSLWVGPSVDSLLLSCLARLEWERERGLKGLVVVPGSEPGVALPSGGAEVLNRLGVDHLALAAPGLEPAGVPFAETGSDEESRHALAESLATLLHRSRASQMYLPLGAGGAADSRFCLDAGLEVFSEGSSRNVFLFEERPELFVSSSVRIRLGEMGARLPPGAVALRDGSSLLRFWLGVLFARHLRPGLGSFSERLQCARRAVRAFRATRAWQPTRALGVRVQPVLQPGASAQIAELLHLLHEPVERAFGSVERARRQAATHARRHGEKGGWLERYWLVLPPREEGGVRTLAPGSASSAA